MKIKPLFDRVVVKVNNSDDKTKSGIVLPTAAQEKQQTATVVAVGAGGMVDGVQVDMVVSVGDTVLYANYAGSEVKVDGEKYVILKQTDILAVLE
ncbi:MAG: co-chaperone GroES [Clostridia bacterium]|nr:co-chaperone GroES [Clostridia bacterium]